MTKTIGVLGLQGAFVEHVNILKRLNVECHVVKTEQQLSQMDALILPGGESTTMALIAEREGLLEPLKAFIKSGKPVWGTCAGMILLAQEVHGSKIGGQQVLGGLHITVKRNAFGHQIDSFVTDLEFAGLSKVPGVFIRAPLVETEHPDVEILCRVPERNNCIVAVRQGNLLATSFHPELTSDTRVHEYFLKMLE
ncbi:PdxT/SNO family [Gorgonomyces haynaldii]|nr:PdxT/SNO family [Gorgonomyces haynaldii]